jgi:hypothetical protein
MFNRLGLDILEHIHGFAGFGDLNLDRRSRSVIVALNERYRSATHTLGFEPRLTMILSHRLIGHPVYWYPHFDSCLRTLVPYDSDFDFFFQEHQNLANKHSMGRWLAESKYLEHLKPWVGYRVLQMHQHDVRAFLTKHARNQWRSDAEDVDIDPRRWFGWKNDVRSLWHDSESVPEVLENAIVNRFAHMAIHGKLRSVAIIGRLEAKLPKNWTWNLVERLTLNGIRVICVSIDLQTLSRPDYVRLY